MQEDSLPDAGDHVVLHAKDLQKSFGGTQVLKGVSLTLHRGEVVVLRGPNGSGKTTLLNILTGNLEADAGSVEVFLDGTRECFEFPRPTWEDLNPWDHFAPERMAREGIGHSWQDIRLFDTLNLRDNIAVACPGQLGENPLWALSRIPAMREQEKENLTDADEILADLGLDGRQHSSADHVSLGQTKRVALARSVRGGARIIFLDEPLAGLDRPGIDKVVKMLKKLARDQQVTLVIVEHIFMMEHVLSFADTVWTLNDGKLDGDNPERVGRLSGHDSSEWAPKFLKRVTGDNSVRVCKLMEGARLYIANRRHSGAVSPLLQLEDVVLDRKTRRVIGGERNDHVEGLSFCLNEGDVGILIAPNGWGKTTLLDAINGVLMENGGTIEAGSIQFRGRDLNEQSVWKRSRLGIASLRSRNQTFSSLTVEDEMNLSGLTEAPPNLEPLLKQRVGTLSGGQKQILSLARSLQEGQLLYLLDEPFSALDQYALATLERQIDTVLTDSRSAMLISAPGSIHKT